MLRKLLLAGAVGGLFSSAALADPFYLNPGFDGGVSDGNTLTANINELGFTGTLATSIYLGNPGAPGTSVIDTNIVSIMNANGFSAGAKTSIAGTPVDNGNLSPDGQFFNPASPGQININSLNTGGSSDLEGFISGEGFPPYGFPVPPLNNPLWGLTYDYLLNGTTTATDVSFTSGYFNIYFEDGTPREQVLRINITSSQTVGVGLLLFGYVSFDFDGNGTNDASGNTFIQNLFNDAATGQNFYDLWVADPLANKIGFRLDTNVDPPLPTAQQLWCTTGQVLPAVCQGPLIRQTSLDGSATFNVPEPGSLALLGIGLAGFAAIGRRRKPNA